MEGLMKSLHLNDNRSQQSHDAPTPPPSAAVSPPTHTPKKEGLFGKLDEFSSAISGHKTPTPSQTPPPPTVAHPQVENHSSRSSDNVFDKLSDAITGKKTPPPPTVAQPPPNQHHSSSVFSHLEEAITGKKTPPPAPPAAPHHESVFDKFSEAITGKKTPPPPPKEENLFDKVGNQIFGIGKPAAHEQKPQGFGDKLNAALGGGAKGEMEEGKLDKAIDLFQEHVLKAGPQSNESALEQAKDKQIADAIRNAIGNSARKDHN
ncbi:hypothetical protein CPB83DRAFT_814184 [Crepidotus variabilis]|uniref:Uncharacterized protein n=1 Tax=Crepidotus variabilis TaxID=179855 RepID=A0A9P6JP90_9AGAR|nr:hypothetical protein CPB83DRAFT_814184 [Crepidotus variabilis]